MPMVQTFTSLQLVRYAYQECSSVENQMLEECLESDGSLRDELESLRDAKRLMPKALFSAHPNSIQNILAYSREQA